MKYKNLFTPLSVFLFCFVVSAGLFHGNVYSHDFGSRPEIFGIVSSVSGSSTISILNDKLSIDASNADIRLRNCDAAVKVGDIEAGDAIEANGKTSNGSFIAEKILMSGPGELKGIIESVGTDTVTILGQNINTASAFCINGIPEAGKLASASVRSSTSGLNALVINVREKLRHRDRGRGDADNRE